MKSAKKSPVYPLLLLCLFLQVYPKSENVEEKPEIFVNVKAPMRTLLEQVMVLDVHIGKKYALKKYDQFALNY